MSFESRLDSESQRWQEDGLISPETRHAILARHPVQQMDPSRVLIPLAVLTAGVGVVLLVAWNWEDLPDAVKLGLTVVLTLVMFGGAARSAGRGRVAPTELWLLGAALAGFSVFAAIADVYRWSDVASIALWCAAAAAVTSAASGALLVTILATVTVFWWMLIAGGSGIPWQFPFVFSLVAIGAEQSRHRVLAVSTTLCFATWPFMMATNVWMGLPPVALSLAAAGAAIDQWSQRPSGRAPIFTRATPGRAIAIIGLIFALAGAVHVSDESRALSILVTQSGRSPWPSLVLVLGLVSLGFGSLHQAALRPRLIALAVAAWFVVSASGWMASVGDWPWIAGFSALLLYSGAAWVREAATSRDVGTFTLGLTAVIGLVVVHFSSGEPLRGAIVLLLCALALFLAGRQSRAEAGGAS